jgi:hypothetical protein
MADENLDADDPFEILGVDRTTPLHEIQERATELFGQFDTNDAITTISNAYEDIADGPHVKEVGGTRNEPLLVDATDDTIAVNESVTVTVTDITGTPVDDAEIKVEGSRKGFTDADGDMPLPFSSAGDYDIVATKRHPKDGHEYRRGTATVDVGKLRRPLKFDEYPDSATVGQEAWVRVTAGNNGTQARVSGTHVEKEVTTDTDGWATVVPTTTGTDIELVATKSGSSNVAYQDAIITIAVGKQTVELAFDDPPSEVTFDDPTEVRVTDQDDAVVEGATVSVPNETVVTDDEGYATLLFDRVAIGEITMSAVKEGADDEEYVPVSTDVTVTPVHVALNLSLVDRSIVAGEPATFEVSDANGNEIAGAFVTAEDADSGTTSKLGRTHITFEKAGGNKKIVQTSKTDASGRYDYAPHKIAVSVDKQKRTLQFERLPSSARPDTILNVLVTTASGDPVEGANVRPDDGTGGKTDKQGLASIEFGDPGPKQVTASKPSTDDTLYRQTRDTVWVKRQRQLTFTTLPSGPVVDEPMDIRVGTEDQEGVAGVTIRYGSGSQVVTDGDGRAQIEPSETGNLQLTATKQSDKTNEYHSTSETLGIDKQRKTLSFRVLSPTATVSEPIKLRVTDDSRRPVSGVRIQVDGDTKGHTNSRGCLTFSHDDSGRLSVRASKLSTNTVSYSSAIGTVEVERPSIGDVFYAWEGVTALGGGGLVAGSALLFALQTPQLAINTPYSVVQAVLQAVFVGLLPPIVVHGATRERYLASPILLLGGGGAIGAMFLSGAIGPLVVAAATAVAVVTAAVCSLSAEKYVAQLHTAVQVLGSLTVAFITGNALLSVLTLGSAVVLAPALVFAAGFILSLLLF